MPTDLFDIEDCDDSGAMLHVVEPAPLIRILDDTVTPAPAAAAR